MQSRTYVGRLPPRWYETELNPDARKGIVLSQPISVLWVKYWISVMAQSASVGVKGTKAAQAATKPCLPFATLVPLAVFSQMPLK